GFFWHQSEHALSSYPSSSPFVLNVLEEAISGTDTLRSLPVGSSAPGKADKKCALFYGVTISEEQARSGIVVRVNSAAQSEFKLLFFEQEFDGGYGLALQASKLR
ncbi:Os03g0262500, partial [Oryza sativa Japonica Group]